MVLRSRFMLFAVTVASATFLAACDGGDSGSSNTTTSGTGTGAAAGTAGTAGSGGGTGGTGGTTMSTSTPTPTGCQNNSDCATDPAGPICNTDTGECVSCIPVADPKVDCGIGSWCNTNKFVCEVGCTGADDCPTPPGGAPLVCDLDTHKCVGCLDDSGCLPGSICVSQTCIPGCSGTQPCVPGETCCGQSCFDLATDENNCGACNNFCQGIPNAQVACIGGQCVQSSCNPNFADCNGKTSDGCETNIILDGNCVCTPGQTQPCYLGAPGTQGVGPCKAGVQTCKADGLGWGSCDGQVLPVQEICANNIDENCDGIMDNAADTDNDGWTTCEGDCNDSNALVNPGAFEVTYTLVDTDNNPNTPPVLTPGGNGVDDDCNPNTSDTTDPSACSTVTKLSGVSADDVAKAMDLCVVAAANPPKPQKTWGLLSASYKLASGADPGGELSDMQNFMAAVLQQYGYLNNNPAVPNNPPKKGPTMAGISSGHMRYTGQAGFASPNGGSSMGSASACPAAYLAAHGGTLPSSAGCSGNCNGGNTCNDSIMVRLQVRVPTNAKSMSYDFKFYSGEFPEWVCTTFNDYYLALLTTGAAGIPMDKNVSFDGLGNPVSVNNGFFDVCSPSGCFNCPKGTNELLGTGMEGSVGGGTSWLTTDAPVVAGETITLELMVFDVGDQAYDSHVLLDNFRWGLNATTVGTHE
ncbi:MAG: choice-of-anchor L domain-containing protein [Polyangiaceae bacterium]|nr:choice-of-anchor L domain-containing protein [Polyangiaceae bacterium]